MSRKTGAGTTAAVDAFAYPAEELRQHWERLHHGDREPFPDSRYLGRRAKRHPAFGAWAHAHGGAADVASRLQDAWRNVHAGDFARAIEIGSQTGALGAPIGMAASADDRPACTAKVRHRCVDESPCPATSCGCAATRASVA